MKKLQSDSITDVQGVRVGQATATEGRSGVTVALFERAVPTVVDVRGGASCTYDTASLAVEATFGRRWAIFFSGGSIFGLDAARGIRTRVLETGGGHTVFHNPVPLAPVSGATLFDLPSRLGPIPDYLPLGYEAARTASRAEVPCGRVGAGAGALIGKYLGRAHAMPGGQGSAAVRWNRNTRIGVLAVMNSVGAVRDPDRGRWIAGAQDRSGRIVPPTAAVRARRRLLYRERGTSLVLVVTDHPLNRPELQRLAVMAHTGLGRVVYPTHTATDGDAVFVTTTREPDSGSRLDSVLIDQLGQATADLVTRAVLRAVAPSRTAALARPGTVGGRSLASPE